MAWRTRTGLNRRRYRLKSVPIVMFALAILTVYYLLTIILSQRQNKIWMGIEDLNDDYRLIYRRDVSTNFTNNTNTTNMAFMGSQFPMDVFTLEQKRMGAIILHVLGIIYMLIGLALVCDEFFVPSIELIIEKLHIPQDVAGATFMAAGGSAPEFFTSLFGIFFARNSIGFGTIVGSAVFNILFVIGLCGLLAKKTLLLTWWPLFRDTSFYTIALAVLIGFFQGGKIVWYESLVLFILYILYVLFMFINSPAEKLTRKIVDKINKYLCCCLRQRCCISSVEQRKSSLTESQEKLDDNHSTTSSGDTALSTVPSLPGHYPEHSDQSLITDKTSFLAEGVLTNEQPHPVGVTSLSVLHRRISNDSGFHTQSELGSPAVPNAVPSVFFSHSAIPDQRPLRPPSKIKAEKSTVALSRESSLVDKHRTVHSRRCSTENTFMTAIITVEPVNIDEVEDAEAQLEEKGEEMGAEEEEDEGIVHIIPPKTWCKRIQYVLFFPIIVLLFFTLPNVRKPRWKWWFPWVFVGSIIWIGVFSYFMVWWATEFGETASIPPSVMGLTILAAGTSIPDLISSVIVARKGYGDMAVSSSIGSNMFDITVGLPVPWLLYSAVNNGEDIEVFSMGLFCSVILLVGMLLITVCSIAIFRWKLGKVLGVFFLFMYVIFVTMGILLELVIVCSIS